MIIEAISEMQQCSECGSMYERDEDHGCSEDSAEDLDEFSGAGAVAGYTLPLGMRPSGPRRDIVNVTRRSFGGISKKKKRNS